MFDRIRVINKHVTNKILIHISGKQFGHFAILSHVGRKSGKIYRIPIIAEPLDNGFVIALTYGKKVDWYENVLANGGCSLRWKGKDYTLINPEFIEKEGWDKMPEQKDANYNVSQACADRLELLAKK